MGTNSLTSISSGIIRVAHPNQYFTALSGDFVPRNSLGAPVDNSSNLGSSTYRWASATVAGQCDLGSVRFGTTSYNNFIYNVSTSLVMRTNSVDRVWVTSAGKMGVGNSPQGFFHVTSDAGTPTAPDGNGDDLVVENTSGQAGVSILSANSSYSNIFFGRTSGVSAGKIEYSHGGTEGFSFKVSSAYTALLTTVNFSFTNNATYLDATSTGVVVNNGLGLHLLGGSNASDFTLYNASGVLTFRDKNSVTVGSITHLSNTTTPVFQMLSSHSVASTPTFDFQNTAASVDSSHYLLTVRFLGDNNVSGAGYIIFADGDNVTGGVIADSATTVQYATSSDKRLKKDFQDFNGIDFLKKIEPVKFVWKKTEKMDYGFVAQDLYKVIPGAVRKPSTDKHLSGDYKGKIQPWSVDYGRLTPYLAKAMQEMLARIEELESKVGA